MSVHYYILLYHHILILSLAKIRLNDFTYHIVLYHHILTLSLIKIDGMRVNVQNRQKGCPLSHIIIPSHIHIIIGLKQTKLTAHYHILLHHPLFI